MRKAGPFELEGRYGVRARNCDGFGAGAVVRWLVLASHPGLLSTRTTADLLLLLAIYLPTADNSAHAADSAMRSAVEAVPLTDISGQPRTAVSSAGQTMDKHDPETAASLEDLAACLRYVHLRADRPTYRTLEQQTATDGGVLPSTRPSLKKVRLTRTIVSDVLAGRKFPGKAFLLTFVDACGIDLENDRRWEQAWDRLAIQYPQVSAAGGAEKLRQENEELRRQLTAAKRQAEKAENRADQAQAQDMNETQLTIVGDLVNNPELRFTPSGEAIARFRIASTPRYYDKQAGEWRDGETLFLTCNVWRQLAENVAESLQQGTRAIVAGKLRQRSYETKDGEKRTVYEVEVDEVSASLQAQDMNETRLTIVGDLVNNPELRFTPSGEAIARFRIASTPRYYDKQAGEWRDGETLFLTCNVWRQLAENVAESLQQGTRAIVAGKLRQRSYETEDGEKRAVYEVEVDEVGASLLNGGDGYSDEPPF